jgi:hypothetical protein
MTKDEALKLALEALTNAYWPTDSDLLPAHNIKECGEAITAIKAALEAKDEPWEQFYPEMGKPKLAYLPPTESPENACYIPPQRTWVGMTDEDFLEACQIAERGNYLVAFQRIQAKLRSKNESKN